MRANTVIRSAVISAAFLCVASPLAFAMQEPEPVAGVAEHENLPAANIKLVSDGMTFGDLTEKLGTGTPAPEAGGNEIRWYFDDGCILAAKAGARDQVMHLGAGAQMWWISAPPIQQVSITELAIQTTADLTSSAISSLKKSPYFHQMLFSSIGAFLLFVFLFTWKWVTLVRLHNRTVADRLFRAHTSLPPIPWGPKHRSNGPSPAANLPEKYAGN
jgi:hypothetical protein